MKVHVTHSFRGPPLGARGRPRISGWLPWMSMDLLWSLAGAHTSPVGSDWLPWKSMGHLWTLIGTHEIHRLPWVSHGRPRVPRMPMGAHRQPRGFHGSPMGAHGFLVVSRGSLVASIGIHGTHHF